MDIANLIAMEYDKGAAFPYTRVHRLSRQMFNKSDTMWNININQTAKSLRGVLLLFEDPSAGAMGPAYARNPEYYHNPLITNVSITVEGIPNVLYPQGMKAYQQWDEITTGWLRNCLKDTEISSADHTNYFQNRYALWLDFRLSSDEHLDGGDIALVRLSDGMVLQITKIAQTAGPLYCYIYLLMDAQLNIQNGRFLSSIY